MEAVLFRYPDPGARHQERARISDVCLAPAVSVCSIAGDRKRALYSRLSAL